MELTDRMSILPSSVRRVVVRVGVFGGFWGIGEREIDGGCVGKFGGETTYTLFEFFCDFVWKMALVFQ